MPPKKQTNKRQEEKVKKIVEDKTFGLKNKKKSAKVQKYVEEIKKQVTGPASRKKDQERTAPSKKELEAEKKTQLNELFKPVIQQQKVPFGTDPKTILCAYFKAGQCTKGDKCKFSHDIHVERKSAKIDLYTDKRANQENGNDKEEESMEQWNQEELESVIKSKHGNPRTQTEIVCKYFLEAIETSKYGWFWTCPNGGDLCKYRHALPPGYVLKKKDKTDDADTNAEETKISLEEYLESERLRLGPVLTPITYETFTAWKEKRKEAQRVEAAKQKLSKQQALKAGQKQGLSGRDLFTFNPEWAHEDHDNTENVYGESEMQYTHLLPPGPLDPETADPCDMDDPQIDESLFMAETLDDLNLEDLEEFA